MSMMGFFFTIYALSCLYYHFVVVFVFVVDDDDDDDYDDDDDDDDVFCVIIRSLDLNLHVGYVLKYI